MTFKTKLLILALIPAVFAMVGCGGDSGKAYSPTVVDTAPPAVPYGLEAQVWDSGEVLLKWNINTTDADFDGFKVYRVVDRQMVELTPDLTAVNGYTDSAPAKDSLNEYRISAFDFTGNESGQAIVSVFVGFQEDPSLDPSEDDPSVPDDVVIGDKGNYTVGR
ncbi:MAG: hypothetical protein GY752_09670 [bacterium]|nr:hypothetical protein [bacterium]MCP4799881.1 hypothetical protein [bacterium]